MIGEERTLDDPYLPGTEWRLVDAFLVIIAGIVGAVVLGGFVVAAVRGSTEMGTAESVIILTAQQIGSITALAVLSQSRGSGRWRPDFGLVVRFSEFPWLFAGALLQLAAVLVVLVVSQAFNIESPPQQSIVEVTTAAEGGSMMVVLVLLIVVAAPIVEEVTFRGILLSRLRRSLGPWPSILISAAAFAGLHFVLDRGAYLATTGLFVVGVALGWAALRRGDLGVPIFLHVGVNLLGVVALLAASGESAAIGTWHLVLST